MLGPVGTRHTVFLALAACLGAPPAASTTDSVGLGTGTTTSDDTGLTMAPPSVTSASATATPETSATGSPATSANTNTDTNTETSTGGEGGSSSGGVVVDPSLLLWLRFEQDPADEVVDDGVVGFVAGCIAPACPTSAPGVFGMAAAFDGVDDHIRLVYEDALATTSEVTIAFWARFDTLDIGDQLLLILGVPVGDETRNTWEFYIRDFDLTGTAEIVFALADTNFTDRIAVEPPFVAGDWVHLVGVWDGAAGRLWIDGVAAGPALPKRSLAFDGQDLVVGADQNFSNNISSYFPGALDDVRVYDRALTPGEIADLAMADE